MLRFLMFVGVIIGITVLIKPELIDIAKEEMQMRERTNNVIEQNAPVSIHEAIMILEKNHPSDPKWEFGSITEDVGSLFYTVSDKNVFDIVKYKTNHDVTKLLKENKEKAVSLLCSDETILNLLAHETVRYVYVQYYDRQGIDYGKSLIDNGDCGLWPFSIKRVIDKAF